MERAITRKNVGYFGCLYAGYLKAYYPEAYERFIAREDHIDLLKKYNVYCHEHMTLLLEILRNEAGFCPRKELQEGLQQEVSESTPDNTGTKKICRPSECVKKQRASLDLFRRWNII